MFGIYFSKELFVVWSSVFAEKVWLTILFLSWRYVCIAIDTEIFYIQLTWS